jgi:glutamate-ammonia-ligase adenylyltransferase
VTEVAQRVLKALAGDKAIGPLYRVDTRLRPHGASGPLVVTLGAFEQYFETSAQSWERLALTRARVIFATGGFGRRVTEAIRSILARPIEAGRLAADVLAMRRRLQGSRASSLKRGTGGLADIEVLVQYLMLINASIVPGVLRPNVWDALDALRSSGILPSQIHKELLDAYNFLRSVEGRLRLIHNRASCELPAREADLLGLARRLNYPHPDPGEAVRSFLADMARHTTRTRTIFEQYVGRVRTGD